MYEFYLGEVDMPLNKETKPIIYAISKGVQSSCVTVC